MKQKSTAHRIMINFTLSDLMPSEYMISVERGTLRNVLIQFLPNDLVTNGQCIYYITIINL